MSVLLTSLLTVLIGSALAYWWQEKSVRDARFFEGTKQTLDNMTEAYKTIASQAGRRIYHSQRIFLMSLGHPSFQQAADDFVASNVEWNRELLSMEVSIRTLFRNTYTTDFEGMQSRMRQVNLVVGKKINGIPLPQSEINATLSELGSLRHEYFQMVQGMIKETDNLFRQMHFGILLPYDEFYIDQFSTPQLLRALWTGPKNQSAVIGSPANFGLPISASDARLGVH